MISLNVTKPNFTKRDMICVQASYDSQQDIQLMRFADYFGRAFSSVGGAQFPWLKMLKESSVAKIVDVIFRHLSASLFFVFCF